MVTVFFIINTGGFSRVRHFEVQVRIVLFCRFLRAVEPRMIFQVIGVSRVLYRLIYNCHVEVIQGSHYYPVVSNSSFRMPSVISIEGRSSISLEEAMLFGRASGVFSTFFYKISMQDRRILRQIFDRTILSPQVVYRYILISMS